jgi:diguanylate cyclase (GGDEF)-like protein/PAS domain S-box-containing protein
MAPDTNPLAASTLSMGAHAEKPYADRHILIVEDEPTVSQLVSQAIQRNFGCNIETVSNGDAALETFDPALHDAIVTDMNMPGVHGLELISALRKAGPDVGIIVMTGLPNEFPYVKVVQAGANDFLHKPFQPAELHAKILRILRERDLLQEQQRAQKKYRSLFELSADGMVMMNGTDYRVLEANPAFEQFSGKSEQALCEQSILECFAARDRMRFEQWLSVITRAGKGTMADLVVNREDGVSLHVDVSVTVIETEKEGLIYAAFKDITDRRETQDRLAEQAQKDELTGLHNKRSFHSRIEGALARARQGESTLTLFLIDLDNFKACNDTHGHQIGDKLLVQVGQAVRKSIRVDASDMGFRFGGDEFAVMLAGANAEGSVRVAERIQQEFGKNETYGTTMSIGVALYEPTWSKDELIRHADDALYKAKGQGKNAVALAEVTPA